METKLQVCAAVSVAWCKSVSGCRVEVESTLGHACSVSCMSPYVIYSSRTLNYLCTHTHGRVQTAIRDVERREKAIAAAEEDVVRRKRDIEVSRRAGGDGHSVVAACVRECAFCWRVCVRVLFTSPWRCARNNFMTKHRRWSTT